MNQTPRNGVLVLGDLLSLNRSQHVFDRLTGLWTGRVVYQRHWEIFLQELDQRWLGMECLVSQAKTCVAELKLTLSFFTERLFNHARLSSPSLQVES